MGALSPESVLVGDVVDGVENSVGAGVRVRALLDLGLHVGAGVLQVALLLGSDSITSGVAGKIKSFKVWLSCNRIFS